MLGIGGGREAIPLAKMGFQITGIDIVPELIIKTQENFKKSELTFEGRIQNIIKLDVENNCYDVVWICSNGMYSSVPSQNFRIEMLRDIYKSLKTKGFLICQFLFKKRKYIQKHRR